MSMNKLNEVFDIATEVIEESKGLPSTYPAPPDVNKEDLAADYEYARNNFHLLIEKGNTAIEGILQLAREGENARSYEVAGQLIKSVADVTGELLKLQKQMKELHKIDKEDSPKSVTNALFIGSTAELQKLLKGEKEKVIDNDE